MMPMVRAPAARTMAGKISPCSAPSATRIAVPWEQAEDTAARHAALGTGLGAEQPGRGRLARGASRASKWNWWASRRVATACWTSRCPQIEGKEFFTAELDIALREREVDFSVHSLKDLALDRPPGFMMAAVPKRANPRDFALFAPDVPKRLAAGASLRIGTSSPRRAELLPHFLAQRPAMRRVDASMLENLRGNVDSRLRRLHEPRGSERHLDGVVLAPAGLSRLFADTATERQGRQLLTGLLEGLNVMVLPLSESPGAPGQGALAIECRADDAETRAARRTGTSADAWRHRHRTRAAGRTWRRLPPAFWRDAAMVARSRRIAAHRRPQRAGCGHRGVAFPAQHRAARACGRRAGLGWQRRRESRGHANCSMPHNSPASCAAMQYSSHTRAHCRRVPPPPSMSGTYGPPARRAGSRWLRRASGYRAAGKAWARKPPRNSLLNPCCACRRFAVGCAHACRRRGALASRQLGGRQYHRHLFRQRRCTARCRGPRPRPRMCTGAAPRSSSAAGASSAAPALACQRGRARPPNTSARAGVRNFRAFPIG